MVYDAIQLGKTGVPVLEDTGPDSTRDDEAKVGSSIGLHPGAPDNRCGCLVDRQEGDKHDVLKCRGCNKEVRIPKEIQTIGDLREHFKEFSIWQ